MIIVRSIPICIGMINYNIVIVESTELPVRNSIAVTFCEVKDFKPQDFFRCGLGGFFNLHPAIGATDEDGWFEPWRDPSQLLTPTHWMPLPSPPEDK